MPKSLDDSDERRFAAAFRAIPYSISLSELATGRYVDCNAGFERASGYTRAEVVGRTSMELDLWVDLDDRRRLVERMAQEGTVRDLEVRFRAKGGRVVVALCNCDVVEVDGVACLLNTFEDVTERRVAEQALRESRELVATAFRASPNAMSILDEESGRYLEINDAFVELYGHAREHVLGRTPLELGEFEDPADGARLLERLSSAGSLRDVEVRARTRDGCLRVVSTSAERVHVGGRRCVLRVTRDITAEIRARAERVGLELQLRQSQKLEALGTLAGGIAHDFNNILTASLNFTDLAIAKAHDPVAVRELLGHVDLANLRARDLVRRILAFSRRTRQERRPTSLVAIVSEAMHLLESTLPKNVQIDASFAADTPRVLADATQIHQVVMNLGTNAAHAIGDRPGTLVLRVERVARTPPVAPAGAEASRPRWYARIVVADDGEGMDPETLRQIFDPFFTTKAPGEGTGLGLSVVHGIVTDHEGAIEVESRPGAGTTFVVDFPALETGASDEAGEGFVEPKGRGEHVLLVDDEAEVASAVQLGLERLGFRVTAVSDPVKAVRRFHASPIEFDVVVTDYAMPSMTGVDLARTLLATRPDVKIILMSGYSDMWTNEAVRALGLREPLNKPLSASALALAIRRSLDD